MAPSFFGIPPPLSPDSLVLYAGSIKATDPSFEFTIAIRAFHPTVSGTPPLPLACENYTLTIRAENKAGSSNNVSKSFVLVESGEYNILQY